MNKEELIQVLREFDEKRVEELPEKTRNIFYAIMKIADERDELADRCEKAIDKLYCWGEVLDPDFQSEMLDILKGDYNG